MRRILIALSFPLLITLLVACGPSAESSYRGYLYFAQDSYVMQYSLRDGSISMVTGLGDRTIREISPMGEGKLLISELAALNRKRVARISWLDLKTGQSESLYSGVRARLIPEQGIVAYDDGSKLYAVSLVGDTDLDSVIMAHRRHQLTAMAQVSGSRLLFEVQQAGGPVIYAYHADTGDLHALDRLADTCELDGAVWIGDLELLACRDRNVEGDESADSYVLADLDGNLVRRLVLPEGGKYLALAYLDGQGAIVFRESWRSDFSVQPKSALWAHDIQSGTNRELSDSLDLGSSAVYSVR